MPLTEKDARGGVDASDSAATTKLQVFWLFAALIALLGASQLAREINRPYYGLHSVDQAHNAWLARSHVVYGLGYTKGLNTFAVGSPPAAVPQRYLDHPVLYSLLDATAMRLLGVERTTLRITNLLATVLAVLLFMRLLRALRGDALALVAGLFFVQLPLIAYFGVNQWLYPLCLLALWCYLTVIGCSGRFPEPTRLHLVGLGSLLFVTVQINWQGFFFALAIGVHYVARCLRRREWPAVRTIALLAAPPIAGTAVNFLILAAADGWDFGRLVELASWRAGAAERETHEWGAWLARVWEFSLTNFTLVVLVLGLVSLTLGQLLLHLRRRTIGGSNSVALQFPQFWLFSMPAVFQLLLLKGVVWEHQWWLRPLAIPLSIAGALGVLQVFALLAKVGERWAWIGAAGILAAVFVSTSFGTNDYYGRRNYDPERLEMFDLLAANISPDRALLSFESYVFDQKPGVKQSSYRPEVAWHLNRDIVVARTLAEIESEAQTGRYPYYLMPKEHRKPEVNEYLADLAQDLQRRYTFHEIRASPDQWLFELRQP